MARPRFCFLLAIFLLAPVAHAAGDASAGKDKSAPCIACHGIDGNSINPEWPSLSGQGKRYLITQMQRFRSGERNNVLMSPQAATLSDQDILDLAAYYSEAPAKAGVSSGDEASLKLGEQIYRGGLPERNIPACIACHGPDGAGNAPAQYPRLAGQHATYMILQLRSYREAFEAHKSHTRSNPMMNSIAAPMTNREIEAVSNYIPGLH